MSTNPKRASELLSSLYVEREDNQWRTVTNCLESLASGDVIPTSGLIAVAFNLLEDDSPYYKKLISRAQKMSNRTGSAGRVEVRELAKAAITIAVLDNKDARLAAHVSRIGFSRELESDLALLVQAATKLTIQGSTDLTRRIRTFPKITDSSDFGAVQKALDERDKYLHDQLWERDETLSTAMAALSGQINLWVAFDELLSRHSFPYPYRYEIIAIQSCLAAINPQNRINKLPLLPQNLKIEDSINLPFLSYLSSIQDNEVSDEAAFRETISDISLQLTLELIFLQ